MCPTHVTAGSRSCRAWQSGGVSVSSAAADGELAESPVSAEEVQVTRRDAKLLRVGDSLFLPPYRSSGPGESRDYSGSTPALHKKHAARSPHIST